MKLLFRIIFPLLLIALAFYFVMGNNDGGIQSLNSGSGETQLSRGDIGRDSILPLPPVTGLSSEKVGLGRKLFHEVRLSHDNSISCASCHDLNKGGTDRLRFSVGINGAIGSINAPTVFNTSLNIAQFWDGRAKSLEEQAAAPIHNSAEMGSNWQEVVGKLGVDDEYGQAFRQAYTDGMTPVNIADALAVFERSLTTPNARFDRYLRGDKNAVTNDELEGYHRFVDRGCASCHQGVGIGGNLFQRFGVMGDYFKDRPLTKADLGRFNVTGLDEDRFVFKVPSLRNVAVTSPYFHDGSVQTLEKAVKIMGHYQLGIDMPEEDVRLIVAFLHSITGEWEGRVLE